MSTILGGVPRPLPGNEGPMTDHPTPEKRKAAIEEAMATTFASCIALGSPGAVVGDLPPGWTTDGTWATDGRVRALHVETAEGLRGQSLGVVWLGSPVDRDGADCINAVLRAYLIEHGEALLVHGLVIGPHAYSVRYPTEEGDGR